MTRLPPWIVVLAVWAAIYLPALGSFEIKGEEGRRILPAIEMIESGNYLQPHVGSDTYFSKPPLVNWLVAAAFKLSGIRSEWTARLPSALSILVVALTFVFVGRAGLGRGAMIAALIWLTTFGLIEKGRLIEIDAVYVSLCALAMICWMSWWISKRSPWLVWIVPWLWLGLGCLTKGPVHLIFFYATVVAVLWQTKELKSLFHPAHFIGILVMLLIFAGWAVPFLQASDQARGLTKWSAQFTGRVTPHFFHLTSAVSTLVRAIGQFLPWILFVPLIRFSRFSVTNERQWAKGLAWSVAAPLVIISVLPVSAARYSLPVAAPFAWMIALCFSRNAFALVPAPATTGRMLWERVGLPIVAFVAIGSLIGYPLIAWWQSNREKVKNVAAEVNARVPESETVYAVDPGYQPFFFYLRPHFQSLDTVNEVPQSAHYFLVRARDASEASQSERWLPRHPVELTRITDYRNETIVLFEIEGGP